jgi:hypothetical protein
MAKQQGQGAVVAAEPSVARRMWRVLRAVLYMLRRGVPSGRKLAMDLHLLRRRGKFAGKALGDLLTSHHHHRDAGSYGAAGKLSCRALDPGLAVHEPSLRARREVEFSCSNTPSAPATGLGKRDDGGYLRCYENYDAAYVARVFEMLNDDENNQPAVATPTAYATPSPARLLWAFARSPAVRRVVAASPAPSGGSEDAQVDRQADEFIRRFYEQLRAQRSAASTPDYYHGCRRTARAIA